jgi:uncharacterized membrane protein
MTTDREMAMRVHVALGGTAADFPEGSRGHDIIARQRLVDIGRELDEASRRDVAAEVVAAGEVSR